MSASSLSLPASQVLGLWDDKGTHFYLKNEYLIKRDREKGKEGEGKEGERPHLKRGFVPTSKLPVLMGLVDGESPQQVAEYIKEGKKVPVQNARKRDNGVIGEPLVFKWYNDTIEPVKAAGAAVSKDTPWLVSIADGEVGDDGLLEIKVRDQLDSNNLKGMIMARDYVQLLAEMHSYHRKWVDYVVLGRITGQLCRIRVYFDPKIWAVCQSRGEDFVKRFLLSSSP